MKKSRSQPAWFPCPPGTLPHQDAVRWRRLQLRAGLRLLRSVARRRGLTYGEMMIVLAVFLILSIAFIMSSQTVMVKTKLSRVLQEQKMLASALNTYEAEFTSIPTTQQGLARLERPIVYIPRVPIDPFSSNPTHATYDYFGNFSPRHKWVIISAGPNGEFDLAEHLTALQQAEEQAGAGMSAGNRRSFYLLSTTEAQQLIQQYRYDPTNGTVSGGDVISVYGE